MRTPQRLPRAEEQYKACASSSTPALGEFMGNPEWAKEEIFKDRLARAAPWRGYRFGVARPPRYSQDDIERFRADGILS